MKSIGQFAFQNCTSLASITIPSSVTSIADGAFSKCGITVFTVDKDNPTYQSVNGLLMDKSGKTLVAYPCGSTSDKYTIPNYVTSIGGKAFYGCTGLKSITIPSSVTSIGDEAFSACTSLGSITIPGSVTSIGQYAFNSCITLKNVTIGNGVTSIGQGAFWDCNNLESVSIMGNPKIGDGAIPNDETVTLSLTANDANGAKWMTFYNDYANFQADANTTVYKATVSGQSLVLTEVADKIVNAKTAVILRSSSDPVMTLTETESSDTQDNALLGTMEATATPANTYTLASGSKGVGFYRYTGDKVAAGKAYIIHNGASSAREFIGFDEEGETTGIVAIDHSPLTIDHSPLTIDHSPFTIDHSAGAWYSIDGRKLQGGPSKKGIYVRNGLKVVIK